MVLRRKILASIASLAILATTTLPAAAQDRKVTIVNNTGFTIVRFYGSNKGSTSWEEDILGSDVLGPNSSVSINFDDGTGYCKFDFRAEFNDGDVIIEKNINICEIGTFTYN
ncbi:MAG: hypothetical protein COB40_07810 [Marinosulfonomonas sp.]|nr:MAG: hypothetical protein COB40_07810 [Marinosulfonomonas sp.]